MSIAPSAKAESMGLPQASLSLWQDRFRSGRFRECADIARDLVNEYPEAGKAWQLSGASLLAEGRASEALPLLRRATGLAPTDWSIWDNLAIALQRLGNHEDASEAFRVGRKLAPSEAVVWSNASVNELESGNSGEALSLALEAVRLAPGLAAAHLGLGNALSASGRSAEAEAAFLRALSIQPAFPEALLSLGRELSQRGRYAAAIETIRRALAINPRYAEAHVNLASDLNVLGDIVAADTHYRRALALQPDMIAAWSGALYCMLHDDRRSPEEVTAEHRRFGDRVEAPWKAGRERHPNDPDPNRRLRLGFVSGDLRDHPVARFLEPVWRTLDRDRFESFVYDLQPSGDETALRLRALAARWTNAAPMPDSTLEACIRRDCIDILFDLSGHTAHGRPGVFARKPAPVQVSWLGYPGTTGLSAIDYRLVDPVAAPPGRLDRLFTEHLAYLPFMSVFDRPAALPEVGPSPFLAQGHLTFGSFNRINKLGDRTVDLWSKVLRRIPTSRLLVGALPDKGVADEFRKRFVSAGIADDRLAFLPRVGLAEYLKLHEQIDILLDTLPFSSGTTANFALWMGVPTLTLAGNSMAQRLGASRMAAAGLESFIAESEHHYLDLAVDWASRPAELARIRGGLRGRMEENFASQPVQLSRALEKRLREMWERWCAGLEPERLP
jgi:protein O-GlcNAc transferase